MVSFALHGQVPLKEVSSVIANFEQEHTEIVINTNLSLAGERLYYQIFNLTDSLQVSHLSKVAYLSLRDERDSTILNHKVSLTDGLAHGFFYIPTSLTTGVYNLLCHTNFSLNHPKRAVSARDVFILNPFKKVEPPTAESQIIEIAPANISDLRPTENSLTNGFQIKTDQPSYQPRDKIELSISLPKNEQGSGHFALSVRRIPPIQVLNPDANSRTYEAKLKDLFFLPEYRGDLISGQLAGHSDTTKVANRMVALSLPGNPYIFKMARTDQKGRFFVSIDQPNTTMKGVAQIVDPDRQQFLIDFYKKEIAPKHEDKARSLRLNPEIRTWLEKRSVQQQIQNAYFKPENIRSHVAPLTKAFYGKYGREFLLDDYTRFPTVRETFVEVIKLARIRKKDGKEVFEVFDPDNPYKTGPFGNLDPLVLLDGIFIQDAAEVTRISAFEIDRIHVIPKPYRYGPGLFGGIIDIRTQDGEARILQDFQEFKWEPPLSDRTYTFPHYENQDLDRIPDQRVQLYWKPNLYLMGTSLTEVFYASDLTGTFEIVLEGYTTAGVYTKATHFFRVE